MKTASLALGVALLASNAAHANHDLPDDTRLVDILPGAEIVVTKAMGQFDLNDGIALGFSSSCSWKSSAPELNGGGEGYTNGLYQGTRIPMVMKFHRSGNALGEIEIMGGDRPTLVGFCNSDAANPFTDRSNITVGDLRKSLGGKVQVEGRVKATVSDRDQRVSVHTHRTYVEEIIQQSGESGQSAGAALPALSRDGER